MNIDLHTHTTASDGSDSPSELVAKAGRLGLDALGVTDHDTVDGLDEALVQTVPGLEVVPGIEFTTDTATTEVHLLGYYLDHHHPELLALVATIREERIARAREMVSRLGRLGLPVPWEEVWEAASRRGFVGRGQIVRVMKRRGLVPSEPERAKEFLNRYLSREGAAYVPHSYLNPEQAIAAIRRAGGVPVLAHPGRAMTGVAIDDGLIARLTGAGLLGLEAYYPSYEPGDTLHLLRVAERLGLIPTGGTDYHGRFGATPLGSCSPPGSTLGRLKEAADKVRRGR
ncbi:MAG: PHP domain-containing protein [Chitinophagales bacterium]